MWLSPRLSAVDDARARRRRARPLAGLGEGLRERHADVAGADHGDVLGGDRRLRGFTAREGYRAAATRSRRARRRRAAAARPGMRAAATAAASRVRVVVDEHVRARLDRVDPLRRRPQRHARHAVPVRLLLQPARVGDDHARLRGERGEVEVAERRRSSARSSPSPASSDARACAGAPGRRPAARRGAVPRRSGASRVCGRRSPRGAASRRRSRRARRRAASSTSERSRAIGAKSRERVGHHVADDLDPARDALALEHAAPSARRGRAGAPTSRSTSIRLRSSGIDRSKLRSPASTCATGTPPRAAAARRRASSSCRRRRAPSRAAPRATASRIAGRASSIASRACRSSSR